MANGDDPKVEKPELPDWRYTAALNLLNQAEGSTWQRLTGFLTMSGFLFTAWGVTVSASNPAAHAPWNRIPLAAIGVVLSVIYTGMMHRSRAFVGAYVNYAKDLEAGDGPLTHGDKTAQSPFSFDKRYGSAAIAPLVPALVGLAFTVLLGFALRQLKP